MIHEIGLHAGKIWNILDEKNGQMPYRELKKKTGLSEQEILLGIGWLSHEYRILNMQTKKEGWVLQLVY